MTKEEIRRLFTIFSLFRWMKDESNVVADYETHSTSKVNKKLNHLFSGDFHIEELDYLIREIIDDLKYFPRLDVFRQIDFTDISYYFNDRRATMEALRWFSHWGEDYFDSRRGLLYLFELIIKETATPTTSQYSSSQILSQLVVGLARPTSGEMILDPCVGQGSFLLETQRAIDFSDTSFQFQTALFGYDVSESVLLIAAVRLLLSGAYNFNLKRKSGLHDDYYSGNHPEHFDVVLAHPPVGLRNEGYQGLAHQHHFPVLTRDAVGMFIQQSLFSLKTNGRAVIAVPEGFLFGRNNADMELRRYLVQSGYIEAVVGIPSKFLIENSGIRGALLLLNKAKKNRKIRMVDLSTYFELSVTTEHTRLPSALAEQLFKRIFSEDLPEPMPLPKGTREGAPGTGALSRAMWDVSIQDIENNDWDLTPKKKIDDPLSILLDELRGGIGHDIAITQLLKLAQIQLGRSIKAAELTDIKNEFGYIRIRDVDALRVKNITSWVEKDSANHLSQYLLQKDDILISKTGTIGKLALVDSDSEGFYAANNFFVLKLNRSKVLAQYLLSYLSSPFCQEWLNSRKRGAAQQNITKEVFESLPVLLPSIELQHKAASQFQMDGTDVLTFIKGNSQSAEFDWAEEWISHLEEIIGLLDSNLNVKKTTAQLSEFAKQALLNKENLLNDKREWFKIVFKILTSTLGVYKIPPGPVLLHMIQDISFQIGNLRESIFGNYDVEERVIRIFSFLDIRLNKIATEVLDSISLNIAPAVNDLESGAEVEFNVKITNDSYLPLKNMVVETTPDIGSGATFYLADKDSIDITLACFTHQTDDVLAFKVRWQAENLAGQQIGGISELAIKLNERTENFKSYEFASNPYVTGSPLEPHRGAMVFYGRDNLINQMTRQIETQGNVILLEGNRRAGKTSILKHLEGANTISNWLVVYSSLQGAEGSVDAIGVPTVEVFREVARTIASAIAKLEIDVPLPDGKVILAGKPALGIARACRQGIGEGSPFTDFREYLEVLLSVLEEKGLGIVLMLDEFDKLQEGIDNGVTSPQVPENLRYLIQNYSRFSAILTGSRRLKRLREEYWSALYGLGTNLAVTALDRTSAEKVVKEPVKDFIAFSEEAVSLILELTAQQAYLIQKVCNRIFDYAAVNNIHSIKSDDVIYVTKKLVKADEHFASLWDYAKLGPATGGYRRQALLLILTKNIANETLCNFGMLLEELYQRRIHTTDEDLDADLSYLRELELVRLCGDIGAGFYRLEIPLMAEWIKTHEDEEIVFKNALNEEGTSCD
ncbi:type I restriction enzyme M protein [Vibrio crassostreae]|nr:type I restriction enzyme M protein [Vibrio crassostreae]